MVATDRGRFLISDARTLYDDALEMLDQGKIRNAAEKAWGATKRGATKRATALYIDLAERLSVEG